MSGERPKSRVVAMACFAVLALACLLPTQAAARSDGKTVTLKLADSHGLHLSFTSITTRKGSFTAEQQGFTNQTTFDIRRNSDTLSYILNGSKVLKGHRIDADLGPFGVVRGKFRIGKLLQGGACNPLPDRQVHFTGTIHLQAENGIATADAHRVDGKLEVFGEDDGCGFKPAPRKGGDPQHLISCGGDSVVYWADHDTGDVDLNHYAQATERVGRILISRFAFTAGPLSTFTADKKLTHAHLSPRGPFNGTATYAGGELTGDLSAKFLGRKDPIPITPARAILSSHYSNRLPGDCQGVVFGSSSALPGL